MKWIGQHIWSLISRFRSDVYLESLTESTQSHVIGVDGNGKLYKQDATTGDITSVVAGTNCSGGGSSGDVTINVDDAFLINSGDDTTSGVITAGGFTTGTTVITDDSVAMASGIINCSGTAEVAGTTVTLDSGANIELEVGAATNYVQTDGIFRGSNIGNILDNKIPISPTMFHSSNYRYAVQYNLLSNGITLPNTSAKAYAEVVVPKGYTATACVMKAADTDNDSTIRCYEGSLNGGATSAVATATTFSSGTATHDFGANDIVGDGATTVIIEWTPGDTVDCLQGGTISIQKTT